MTPDLASGQLSAAEEDWDGAAPSSQRACDAWREVGAPYETAKARTLLEMVVRLTTLEPAVGTGETAQGGRIALGAAVS